MLEATLRLARYLVRLTLATVTLAALPAWAGVGIWTTPEELSRLPMSGPAWENLLREANEATGTPDLSNQDDPVNVRVMAKALVFARTKAESYRQDVIGAIEIVTYGNTEEGGRTLALCRELTAYVIAADLVGLPGQLDTDFRAFLANIRNEVLDGSTMISTHENRPNNWGTHCGDARAAVARYLGDTQDLQRVAQIFKGWLGDRSSYAEYRYGELSWQADPNQPVGINPLGATKEGHDIDGVLPDDQRRAGSFAWPPPKTNYTWGALQGALSQANILYRAGYTDVWQWEDQALRRSVAWLYETIFNDGTNLPPEGDDTWQPYLVNYFYGTSFSAPLPARPGKNVGWTDWTHASRDPVDPGQRPATVQRVIRVDRQ